MDVDPNQRRNSVESDDSCDEDRVDPKFAEHQIVRQTERDAGSNFVATLGPMPRPFKRVHDYPSIKDAILDGVITLICPFCGVRVGGQKYFERHVKKISHTPMDHHAAFVAELVMKSVATWRLEAYRLRCEE